MLLAPQGWTRPVKATSRKGDLLVANRRIGFCIACPTCIKTGQTLSCPQRGLNNNQINVQQCWFGSNNLTSCLLITMDNVMKSCETRRSAELVFNTGTFDICDSFISGPAVWPYLPLCSNVMRPRVHSSWLRFLSRTPNQWCKKSQWKKKL